MGQLDPFKKHNRLLTELKLCGQTSLGEAKALLWCVGTARAGEGILQVLRASGPASDETLVTEESANSQPECRMREIRKSGSEGGARQTNVSFLPLSMSVISESALRISMLCVKEFYQ
jgi:hypothetical protein